MFKITFLATWGYTASQVKYVSCLQCVTLWHMEYSVVFSFSYNWKNFLMQFKSNICGKSKNVCSPLGSRKHSTRFRDERPGRESEVTYSGSAASWCQSGCLSCCLTQRFLLCSSWTSMSRHRLQAPFAQGRIFQSGSSVYSA